MRTVCFLGLATKNVPRRKVMELEAWTLNDWHLRFDWLKPARVYQTHTLNMYSDEIIKKKCGNRMVGWRQAYEKSGAEIVTLIDLRLSRQRIIKPDVERYGTEFYSSTFAYMTQDAIEQGIDKVEWYGVALEKGSEYTYQIKGILENIKALRDNGIDVLCENEKRWISQLPTVDWKNGVYSCRTPYGCEGFGLGVKDGCYNPHNQMECPAIEIVVNNG